MNLMKKVRARLNFLITSYEFSCGENADGTIYFDNGKTLIVFEYDFYRHEYLDLSIVKNDAVIVKVTYGNVVWSNNAFCDESLSQRLKDVFALRHQFIILSEKQIDELVEIYAKYIEDNIEKL